MTTGASTIPAGAARVETPLLGTVLITGAAACFATMDTSIRFLGAHMALLLMLWCRYTMHAVVMGLWLLMHRRGADWLAGFRTSHGRFQALRGSLLLCSSALAFSGLQYLPVAEFTAVVLLTPVLVTVLAALWLRERVTPLRWLLVVGCLAGALVVTRPGSGLFGWAVLFPLCAALCNAIFQIVTTRVGAHDSPYTTNFYTGLTGSLILTPLLLASPVHVAESLQAAPGLHLAVLVAIAMLGTGGHLLLVMSLGRAPTATLMPFLYTQILFAALVGFLVFGVVPDAWGWVGMLMVGLCGAATAWLNLKRPELAADPDALEPS